MYLYRVSEGIKNVTDLKEEYMNAVSNRPNTTIRNIVSTSTEVGVDPAIQVSFNEINTSTTATSTTEREFMSRHIMFLRGEYAYFFSYSASPENFARYEQKVQTMFDSWNTYHFEPKFGDRLEYYDPEFGFRFKYPSGWYGVNSEPEDANILSLVDLKYQEDGTPYFDSGVLMHVLRHTGNLDRSINEIVAGESEIIGDLANFKTEQPQKVILDGLQATLIPTTYANEAGKNQRMDLVLAMKGNILYRIDFYNLNEETRSNIISSFKFEPKIAARRNFTEFSNLRFGTRISAPSDWEYTTGPDETRTFVDTFIFPWKEVDPFYGSLFVSVPDTYYVGRADYNLMTYREDSIAAWSKDYRTFKVLEKGATTTDRGYDVTYFIAEYLSAPETTDKPEKVYALQAFVGHGNVVRFLTFQDDPSDFAILKETALQVIKSLEVL